MEIANYLPGVTPRQNLINFNNQVTKKEWVFNREFHAPDCQISLRPFCILRDMPAINKWVWKLHRASDVVAASYQYTGESDFARSFMVLVNNRMPVCQVDLCQA